MPTRFAAAVSEHPIASTAVGEVVGQVLDAVGPQPAVAFLFITGAHVDAAAEIARAVRELLAPRVLAGGSAVSVIGGPQEVEERPGIALWAAQTGPVVPVRLDAVRTVDGWTVVGVPDNVSRDEPRTMVLLVDPLSFPVDAFIASLSDEWPALTVIGGLASAAQRPGGNRLMLDDDLHSDGAVGVIFPSGVSSRVVVSQGCRPIGDPLVVTRAADNIIHELGGKPALERLQQCVDRATPEEHRLLVQGIHLGVVVDERKEAFARGDFLVRAVLGAEKSTGGIAIGDHVALGTTVQFQVRDAATADEDLRLLLRGDPATAALVFTCNGRGVNFFGEPHHDALLVHEAVGRGAVAGMFCAGEIGPVGARNFLHGYTASVLLFS